jgi:hypothetical protein
MSTNTLLLLILLVLVLNTPEAVWDKLRRQILGMILSLACLVWLAAAGFAIWLVATTAPGSADRSLAGYILLGCAVPVVPIVVWSEWNNWTRQLKEWWYGSSAATQHTRWGAALLFGLSVGVVGLVIGWAILRDPRSGDPCSEPDRRAARTGEVVVWTPEEVAACDEARARARDGR